MLDWTSSPHSGYKLSMAKRSIKKKPARDDSQVAPSVQEVVAPNVELTAEKPEKNPAAVALGRLGGLKGGKARAAKLSSAKRKAIAKKAAAARWLKEG